MSSLERIPPIHSVSTSNIVGGSQNLSQQDGGMEQRVISIVGEGDFFAPDVFTQEMSGLLDSQGHASLTLSDTAPNLSSHFQQAVGGSDEEFGEFVTTPFLVEELHVAANPHIGFNPCGLVKGFMDSIDWKKVRSDVKAAKKFLIKLILSILSPLRMMVNCGSYCCVVGDDGKTDLEKDVKLARKTFHNLAGLAELTESLKELANDPDLRSMAESLKDLLAKAKEISAGLTKEDVTEIVGNVKAVFEKAGEMVSELSADDVSDVVGNVKTIMKSVETLLKKANDLTEGLSAEDITKVFGEVTQITAEVKKLLSSPELTEMPDQIKKALLNANQILDDVAINGPLYFMKDEFNQRKAQLLQIKNAKTAEDFVKLATSERQQLQRIQDEILAKARKELLPVQVESLKEHMTKELLSLYSATVPK